jgi:uncharacterized membrane protein
MMAQRYSSSLVALATFMTMNVQVIIFASEYSILWHIDPMLDKDPETNKTTAMQRHGKRASATIELLLEMVVYNPLLGSCNSWATTVASGVFAM